MDFQCLKNVPQKQEDEILAEIYLNRNTIVLYPTNPKIFLFIEINSTCNMTKVNRSLNYKMSLLFKLARWLTKQKEEIKCLNIDMN